MAADAKEWSGLLLPSGTSLEQGLSSHAGNEEMKQDASCGIFATGALSLHELTTTADTKSDFSLFLSQGEVVVCYRWRSSGSRENT